MGGDQSDHIQHTARLSVSRARLGRPTKAKPTNLLLLEPGGSKYFRVRKKIEFDLVSELLMPRARSFATDGSFVAQREKLFQATLYYLGPESSTVPRRKLLAIYCQD